VFDFRKTTKILCKSIFFNVVQKTTAHFEKKVIPKEMVERKDKEHGEERHT
jgi:hypothetical protein